MFFVFLNDVLIFVHTFQQKTLYFFKIFIEIKQIMR